MARSFQGATDQVAVAAGGLANASRAITVLMLLRPIDSTFNLLGANSDWFTGSASSARSSCFFYDSTSVFTQGDFTGATGPTNKDTWYAVGVGKASGSAPPHYHVATLGGSYTHTTSGNNVTDDVGGTDHFLIGSGGGIGVKNTAKFQLAAVAVWSGLLSDAQVDALGSSSMDDWLAGSPDAAWQFNQASTSDSVTDLTGGGADQTGISGTTVVTDPVGWTYHTGTPTVVPDGIAVPVGLGSPALAQALTLTPDGIAVPVAFGSPTLTWSGAVTPTGIPVTVALGSPTVLGEGQTLLHPTSEQVAVAWLKDAIGSSGIGIDLPQDSSTWPARGFVQVRSVGGTPHVHIPQRQPVISVDCWAAGTNMARPPWFRAAQLAEIVRVATEAADAKRQVVIGGSFVNATIQTVYALTEPRPIPSDVAGYAHSSLDIALTWVETATT